MRTVVQTGMQVRGRGAGALPRALEQGWKGDSSLPIDCTKPHNSPSLLNVAGTEVE